MNEKIYVGITNERNIKTRFARHANSSKTAGVYLHYSIEKYGRENFSIELLCECDTAEEAKSKEKWYIAEWKLNRYRYPSGNGMNLTDGGDGSFGHIHSQIL